MSTRLSEFDRILEIDIPENPRSGSGACFLWGPRKTGKTTLLRQRFAGAKYIDLLDTEKQTDFLLHPHHLREQLLAERPEMVVIDEIQKVPALLDEIHWLLENTATKFVLCGSSARKLKREAANLLGGRAWRYELFPLTTAEIQGFDLDRALLHGTLPAHYLDDNPQRTLKSYTLDYLQEEIIHEAAVRNVPAFARFLETVALTHGCLLNYANVAREAGVTAKTVREYYQILKDTLVGHELAPWTRKKKRRLIETAKFYLFDVGVANHLAGISHIMPGTDVYGRAFEHLLIEEMRAYLAYREKDLPLRFWRTSTGYEVDLVVGDLDCAIEFKSKRNIASQDLRSLRALKQEHRTGRCILVAPEVSRRRTQDDIEIIPFARFCTELWEDGIV
ncbi:MAG: ATP-binding protein [Deltaproteobacteria bacterium]|nr:ATP-binding protein [Deltaproteobacteria bacterium]